MIVKRVCSKCGISKLPEILNADSLFFLIKVNNRRQNRHHLL